MANTLEITYGDHPLNKLDLYYSDSAGTTAKPPLIVYCHGGAWRDEDKSQFVSFARELVSRTGAAVAIVNYRLSPRSPEDGPALYHPAHAQDVLSALHKLNESEPPSTFFDPNRMIVVGHSCGAHMIASIFLRSRSPLLAPSAALLSGVRGIVMSEGIYDIDLLLRTNPDYVDFIRGAFGPATSYEDVSVSRFQARVGAEHVRWLVVHSVGDTLIGQDQTDAMCKGLRRAKQEVEMDTTSVTEEHDEILRTPGFYGLVRRMVIKCTT